MNKTEENLNILYLLLFLSFYNLKSFKIRLDTIRIWAMVKWNGLFKYLIDSKLQGPGGGDEIHRLISE